MRSSTRIFSSSFQASWCFQCPIGPPLGSCFSDSDYLFNQKVVCVLCTWSSEVANLSNVVQGKKHCSLSTNFSGWCRKYTNQDDVVFIPKIKVDGLWTEMSYLPRERWQNCLTDMVIQCENKVELKKYTYGNEAMKTFLSIDAYKVNELSGMVSEWKKAWGFKLVERDFLFSALFRASVLFSCLWFRISLED